MQYEKVKTFFSDIEKEKWNVAVGGKNEDKPGYFVSFTLTPREEQPPCLTLSLDHTHHH